MIGNAMFNFGERSAQTYKQKCKCGEVIEVSTQKDDEPEYYTTVYVKCSCGNSVEFNLPVN